MLRLRALCRFWLRRREDGYLERRPRILVLTYNRTLRGYIHALAEKNVESDVDLSISTFGKWTHDLLGRPDLAGNTGTQRIVALGRVLGYRERFLLDEVDYVLGRFMPEHLDTYADPDFRRDGRGRSPQISRDTRKRLLEQVVRPYSQWKIENGLVDWNDEAVVAARDQLTEPYDVVIADEAQDFSANQIRGIRNHLADEFSLTFVLDRAQRIYARHFTWREVGITIRKTHRLTENYRNTAEIARFALPLVRDLDIGDDGSLPNFTACQHSTGKLPTVIRGRFNSQLAWAIADIASRGLDCSDSVAFLHVAGGGWFAETRRALTEARLPFCEIAQESVWPEGPENIALSTMHSAKGLEFDHVYILGLSAETTRHGVEEGDDQFENFRRLLAMAIGRARETVVIGYKPGEESRLVSLLDPSTFELLDL